MANSNRPSGLSPHSYRSGNPWSGQVTMYYIASTDTNAFSIGDPVTLVSGGADSAGVPGITLATAGTGNVVLGCIVSYGAVAYGNVPADPANINTTIIPATKTKAYYVLVADDPDIIFEVQETNTGTALTAAAVGKNANLKTGTNNGYVSGWTLDNVGTATTSTLQLRILRLVQRSDNAIGAAQKWLVCINNHQFNAGVAGV